MGTKIINIKGTWKDVLNLCRATVNKEPLNKEPSEKFKKSILIAEHSPIRSLWIMWKWNLPHWVGVHWARHKWEKYIATQRTDRTGIDRTKLPQDELQNFIGDANVQNLIDTMRKRLCFMASEETRKYAEDLKVTIKNEVDTHIADVLVPNCIYRCGCPEGENGCNFFKKYKDRENLTDIQARYDMYNEDFYKRQ